MFSLTSDVDEHTDRQANSIHESILVPTNQTFLLNILETDQTYNDEIIPRKHEVGKTEFSHLKIIQNSSNFRLLTWIGQIKPRN